MKPLTYRDGRVTTLIDETRRARQNALDFMADLRNVDSTDPRGAAYLLGYLATIAGHCERAAEAAYALLEEVRATSLRTEEVEPS